MQVLELLIVAGLAAVVLWQLYSVLGRKVGRQPEDMPAAAALPRAADPGAIPLVDDGVALTGLAAIKAREPGFDAARFVGGSKDAYEMIVKAFAEGDRATLDRLTGPKVRAAFEAAIQAREAAGRTESVEFLHAPRADIDDVSAQGDVARVRIRFLAEFRSRTKGPEGEAVDDRRTADVWTFERRLNSRDPNWTLVRVDAAEA